VEAAVSVAGLGDALQSRRHQFVEGLGRVVGALIRGEVAAARDEGEAQLGHRLARLLRPAALNLEVSSHEIGTKRNRLQPSLRAVRDRDAGAANRDGPVGEARQGCLDVRADVRGWHETLKAPLPRLDRPLDVLQRRLRVRLLLYGLV